MIHRETENKNIITNNKIKGEIMALLFLSGCLFCHGAARLKIDRRLTKKKLNSNYLFHKTQVIHYQHM